MAKQSKEERNRKQREYRAKNKDKINAKAREKRAANAKTVVSKKTGKRIPTWEQFIKKNPSLSQSKAMSEYRKKGGSIDTTKARQIFNKQKNITPKEKTRIKFFKASDRKWKFRDEVLKKKNYTRERYMYVVKYKVMRDGMPEHTTEYFTVASPTKYKSKTPVFDIVEAYFNRMQAKNEEKYKPLSLVYLTEIDENGNEVLKLDKNGDTILDAEILYAVDMETED